jgi:hypothetical protein
MAVLDHVEDALGGLVQGCATLSKEECLSADWQTIGYEDGARGRPAQRIGKHREACAQHGIAPDREAYMAGHRQGIRQYCTPARGFDLGQSGKRCTGICPPEVEADFRAAHAEGRAVYLLAKELDHLQAEVRRAREVQQDLEAEIAANEARIISDATPPPLRRQLLGRNHHLERLIEDKQLIID